MTIRRTEILHKLTKEIICKIIDIKLTMKHIKVDRRSSFQNTNERFLNYINFHFVMLLSPMVEPTRPKFCYENRVLWLNGSQTKNGRVAVNIAVNMNYEWVYLREHTK